MKFRKTKNSERIINELKIATKSNESAIFDIPANSLNIIGTIARMYVIAHDNIHNESHNTWKEKENQLNKNIAKLDLIELFIWDQFHDWFTCQFKQDVSSAKDREQLIKKGSKFAKKIATFFKIKKININSYGQLIFNYFWLHEVCGHKTRPKVI